MEWVSRHGCRESRDGPWMARGDLALSVAIAAVHPPRSAPDSSPEAADRPAWLVYVCTAQSVAADEPCEAASGCVAVVKPDTAVVQVNPGLRFYGRFATGRSLRSSSAATGFCARFCDVFLPLHRSVCIAGN